MSTMAIFVKKVFLKLSSFHNIKLFDSILKNSVEVLGEVSQLILSPIVWIEIYALLSY